MNGTFKNLSIRLPDFVDENGVTQRGERLDIQVHTQFETERDKPELPRVTLGRLRKVVKRSKTRS